MSHCWHEGNLAHIAQSNKNILSTWYLSLRPLELGVWLGSNALQPTRFRHVPTSCLIQHNGALDGSYAQEPKPPPPPFLNFHNNAVGSYQSILIAQSFCPQIVFVTDHKVIPLKLEQKNRNWTVSSVYFKIFVHQLSEIPK